MPAVNTVGATATAMRVSDSTGSGIDPTLSKNQQKARIFLSYDGTATEMADQLQQGHKTLCSVRGNAHNIFPQPADAEENGVDLGRVVIMNIKLLQTSNSFPYSVAIQFEGENASCLNTCGRASGKRVAVSIPPGESTRTNQTIYEADNSIDSDQFMSYAHFTPESLSRDIVRFPGKPYAYVPVHHKVHRLSPCVARA